MNIVDHLISKFGHINDVAKAAECVPGSVWGWKEKNRAPSRAIHCLIKNAPLFGVDLAADEFFQEALEEAERRRRSQKQLRAKRRAA